MAKNKMTSASPDGFNEQFDSRLLNAGASKNSSEKAGALNEAKRQGPESAAGAPEDPQTLREATIAQKRENAKKEEEEEKKGGGLAAKAAAPMRKGTSKLLQDAWINLIPSWGLTLIWINIHVFLRLVLGKNLFCKLGDEWLDGKFGGPNPAKEAVLGKAGSKMTEKVNGCANIGESMVLVVLDLVLLLAIMAIIATIAALLQVFENPMKALGLAFGFIWDVTANAIESLISS